MLVHVDTREEYGETRWLGLGVANMRIVVVAFTERQGGRVIRLISMRKPLRHEQKKYEAFIDGLG